MRTRSENGDYIFGFHLCEAQYLCGCVMKLYKDEGDDKRWSFGSMNCRDCACGHRKFWEGGIEIASEFYDLVLLRLKQFSSIDTTDVQSMRDHFAARREESKP